jgi:hypothetical protein
LVGYLTVFDSKTNGNGIRLRKLALIIDPISLQKRFMSFSNGAAARQREKIGRPFGWRF